MPTIDPTLFKELILDPKPKSNVIHDLYGFKVLSGSIKEFLSSKGQIYTIGIYGPWGSGKTTLKNFVKEAILSDPQSLLYPIDFNAWEHEQEEGLLLPLLAQLIKIVPHKTKALHRFAKIATLAISDLALKTLTANMMSVKDITELEKYADENLINYAQYIDSTETIRNDFFNIIQEILAAQNKSPDLDKAVIFIDDLDRCNPDNAIKLIESIKNYFEVPNCVFVLPVDDQVLASFVDKKYEGTKMNGQMYLEKIIHARFNVPILDTSYVQELRLSLGLDYAVEIYDLIMHELTPRRISRIFNKLNRALFINQAISRDMAQSLNQTEITHPQLGKWLEMLIILSELHPRIYREYFDWEETRITKIKNRFDEIYSSPSSPSLSIYNSTRGELEFNTCEFRIVDSFLHGIEREKLVKIKRVVERHGII